MNIMEIITFILALATVWLAFSTYHLARVTKETLDLERRPYLAFQDLTFFIIFERMTTPEADKSVINSANVQIGLILKNPSKVPIIVLVK